MRRIRSLCCAGAANGHAAADRAIPVMKSRRRIAFPRLGTTPFLAFNSGHQNRNFRPGIREAIVNLHCRNSDSPHVSYGAKQRRLGSPMARPVYLQQRTFVVAASTAVECQERRFGRRQPNVRFALHCGHLAAPPRTAAGGHEQTTTRRLQEFLDSGHIVEYPMIGNSTDWLAPRCRVDRQRTS